LKRKKYDSEEMMRDVLNAQRKPAADGTEVRTSVESTSESVHTPNGSYTPPEDDANSILTLSDLQSSPRSPMLHIDSTREAALKPGGLRRKPVPQRSDLRGVGDGQANQEELRHVLASSEEEAGLNRAMVQSLAERDQGIHMRPVNREDFTRVPVGARAQNGTSPSSSSRVSPSYDQCHLAGTTQREYAAHEGEKTALEKTEEEIVLEYIKKQSLLEVQHHRNGTRATEEDDDDDEDLREALEISLQESQARW